MAEGEAALTALNRQNPKVFDRSGAIARIKWTDGAAQIEVFDADSLGLVLDQAADWIRDTGEQNLKVEPPERVVRSLLKLERYNLNFGVALHYVFCCCLVGC